MTYLLFVIFIGICILQFVWVKSSKLERTLILPILFSVIYLVFLIFELDFGNMAIPFTITCIVLWVLFILKLFINKKGSSE